MNVVDCLIITFLFLSGLSGFKRGLLDSVGRLFSLVAGFLVALCYCGDLSLLLQDRFAFNSILATKLQATPLGVKGLDNPLLQLIIPGLPGASDVRLWLAQNMAVVISFLVLLAVTSIVINLLWKPLSGLFQHGVIGVVNRLAGLVLNIAKNALIIAVVFLAVFPLLQGLSAMNGSTAMAVCAGVQDSKILMWLYDKFTQLGPFLGGGV